MCQMIQNFVVLFHKLFYIHLLSCYSQVLCPKVFVLISHTYIYICMYVCMYVYICVCVCVSIRACCVNASVSSHCQAIQLTQCFTKQVSCFRYLSAVTVKASPGLQGLFHS